MMVLRYKKLGILFAILIYMETIGIGLDITRLRYKNFPEILYVFPTNWTNIFEIRHSRKGYFYAAIFTSNSVITGQKGKYPIFGVVANFAVVINSESFGMTFWYLVKLLFKDKFHDFIIAF